MERKGILEFMRKCLSNKDYNKKVSGESEITKLIENLFTDLHKHYGFKDIEGAGKCKHQLRFELLYMRRNAMSFSEIAEETMSDVQNDTFKHHVRNYNKTALQYITEESNVNADYALLLSEYQKSEE